MKRQNSGRIIPWRQIALLASVATYSFWATPAKGAEPKPPINIGSRLELLLDDYLIDSMRNLRFKLHSPQPAERVMRFDAPWEGPYCDYVTVFQDGDRYRMYYANHLDAPGDFSTQNQITCYAYSRDGIHWTKPSLGLVDFQGSKDNNIILHGEAFHNFAPFIDTRAGVPVQERYKAVSGHHTPHVFASADAVHWRRLRDTPILTSKHPAFARHRVAFWGNRARGHAVFDSQNVAFWDVNQRQYVFYFRAWLPNDGKGTAAGSKVRSIFRSTSRDFLTWTDPEPIDFGGAPMEHLYTNATTPYFRAEHLYLAFPMRFVTSRPSLVPGVKRGVCDSVFMFSRDGRRFSRRYLEAFLRPGSPPRNWTKHSVMIAWGLLPTAEDEVSCYFSQHYWTDTNHLRRGVLRTDGFVSLRAGYASGEFTTKPLVFKGNRLVLNVSTSAIGSVRVEIQNTEGKPIDGYRLKDCDEFYGDKIAHTVHWKQGSDLGALAGKPVKLRVTLRDADLYSFLWH